MGSEEKYYRSPEELPSNVRENLPKHAQEIYMKAFNNAWNQYKEPERRRGGAATSREETAHKVAWSAVQKEYMKDPKTGEWVKRPGEE